jgi:hypothetical protein
LIRQLTLACCLTLVARGAAAQHSRRLEFFVVDSTTGTTVGGAEVLIERTVGAVTRSSSRLTADSAGRFVLSAPLMSDFSLRCGDSGFCRLSSRSRRLLGTMCS